MVSESRIVEPSSGASWLERRFRLGERGTSPRIEIIAGATTFLAAAYLLVVIPSILASGGLDRGAATTTTIMVFVAATLFMAFYANLPFIVGPGIGGSAIVATTLVLSEGVPWQIGIGIAFWSGVLFLVLTLLGLREVVTRMVPVQIKLALGASIGLFIAVLGFRNAGLVVANARTNALALGSFVTPGAGVALIGLALAVALHARKIPGSILFAIIGATLAGIPLGVTKLPASLIALPH